MPEATKAQVWRRSILTILALMFVVSRVVVASSAAAWPYELASVITTLLVGTFAGAWVTGSPRPRVAAEVWRNVCRGTFDPDASKNSSLQYLAAECRGLLRKLEAQNYVELRFYDEHGELTVTVQKQEGETPHELRLAAEAEAERLRERLARLEKGGVDA